MVDVNLSWSDGGGSEDFDVYFGTDSTPDSSELVSSAQTATTYDPGTLDHSVTYYWRIDSYNENGITPGDVWNFTTEAATYYQGVNCGGSSADGLSGDQGYSSGSWGHTGFSGTYTTSNTVASDQGLPNAIKSERYGPGEYKFDVPSGTYSVVLYYAETWTPNCSTGERVFDVNIEGGSLEQNDYDIYADVGCETGVSKIFTGISCTDGTLNINFVNVSKNAKINAIEVVQE